MMDVALQMFRVSGDMIEKSLSLGEVDVAKALVRTIKQLRAALPDEFCVVFSECSLAVGKLIEQVDQEDEDEASSESPCLD